MAPSGKMFGVHITLMEGLRLAVRDRGGAYSGGVYSGCGCTVGGCVQWVCNGCVQWVCTVCPYMVF